MGWWGWEREGPTGPLESTTTARRTPRGGAHWHRIKQAHDGCATFQRLPGTSELALCAFLLWTQRKPVLQTCLAREKEKFEGCRQVVFFSGIVGRWGTLICGAMGGLTPRGGRCGTSGRTVTKQNRTAVRENGLEGRISSAYSRQQKSTGTVF